MAKIISFESHFKKRRKKSPGNGGELQLEGGQFVGNALKGSKEFDEQVEKLVLSLSREVGELAERHLGKRLMPEKDTSKLRNFFFNFFVVKLRRIRQHFRAYTYLSQLLSDPNRVSFTYVVDMMNASLEGKPISYSAMGDNCFVIASLWPEWLNRRGNSMKRGDYLDLGASFYYSEALSRFDGSRPLYEDLATNISRYSDVVLEARKVLGFGHTLHY